MIHIGEGQARVFNTLAREDFKKRILNEILVDMNICKLEGRDRMEYVLDIKSMIDDIIYCKCKTGHKGSSDTST